jgi:hypothetical protein
MKKRYFKQPGIVQTFRFGGFFEPTGYGNSGLFPAVIHFIFNNIRVNGYGNHHVPGAGFGDFIGTLRQWFSVFLHTVNVQGQRLLRHFQCVFKVIAAGNAARNIGKIDADSGISVNFKNRKIGKFSHNNLLSFHAGLFKNIVKCSLLQIAFMVRDGYAAFLKRMLKLYMRDVLFTSKPAVITQKFQNFPNRHTTSMRVNYTYIKRIFSFLAARFSSLVLAGLPSVGTFCSTLSRKLRKLSAQR